MSELSISIGELTADVSGGLVDESRIEMTLRNALGLLTERLRASPFARDPETLALVLTSLQISDISADAWLGQRGAERVADALYQQLSSQLSSKLST